MGARPVTDQDWRDSALCAQVDWELFFPEKGGSVRPAQAVCGACEVRAECLEWAMETQQEWGVWGGLSADARKRLRRAGNPEPAAPLAAAASHLRGSPNPGRHNPDAVTAAVAAVNAGERGTLAPLSKSERDEVVTVLVGQHGKTHTALMLEVGARAVDQRLCDHRNRLARLARQAAGTAA